MSKLIFQKRSDDYWVFPKLSKYSHSNQESSFFDFLNSEKVCHSKHNIYIHIPFCEARCFFCPYYKEYPDKKQIEIYVNCIIKELEMYASRPYFKKNRIDAIHFGGGNPLLLTTEQFKKIILTITNLFEFSITDENISVEGSVNCLQSEEYIEKLLETGINRLSVGIQTFDQQIRDDMKIKPSIEQIYHFVDIMKKIGFHKYCFDMMYNLPNQSEAIFKKDLEIIDSLDPYHIDIYNMAVFPNTMLYQKVDAKEYKITPSNENNISLYMFGHKWLIEHGYNHIITNTYSKYQTEPDIGDFNYLHNGNVLGIGTSSRSYINGKSFKNYDTNNEFIKKIMEEQLPIQLTYHASDDEIDERRMVFFPILMKLDIREINNFDKYKTQVSMLEKNGYVTLNNNILKLTEKGKVWSGNISECFMSEDRWKEYMKIFLLNHKVKCNPYNEDEMGV